MDSDIESLETLAGFISNSRLLELENLADGIDGGRDGSAVSAAGLL